MSKKANPAVVGAFVIGAMVFVVAAILIFGSGKFFEETSEWVLYFDGSIKGLSVGSPVLLSGVQIGSVTNIQVVIDEERHIRTPVTIKIERSRLNILGGELSEVERRAQVRELIKKGLRAQLQLQSLVTGQLMIQFGFFPNSPVKLVNPDGPIPELPTIPSAMQQVSRTLESLPIEEIMGQIKEIADGINKLVNSPDLGKMLESLSTSFEKLQEIMAKLEKEIGPLSTETHETLVSTKKLVDSVNAQVGPISSDIHGTVKDTRAFIENTNKQVEQTARELQEFTTRMEKLLGEFIGSATASSKHAEKMLAEGSEFRYQVNDALTEFRAAGRAMRLLAEYLEEHPEALLKGKQK